MSKKFNLRWLSLSKPPYLVQWSFRQVVPEPFDRLRNHLSKGSMTATVITYWTAPVFLYELNIALVMGHRMSH